MNKSTIGNLKPFPTESLTHNTSRKSFLTSCAKTPRCALNSTNDTFLSNLNQINKQSSNIQLNQSQILSLLRPIAVIHKNIAIAKQSVWSFTVLSVQPLGRRPSQSQTEAIFNLTEDNRLLRLQCDEHKARLDGCLKENRWLMEVLSAKRDFNMKNVNETIERFEILALKPIVKESDVTSTMSTSHNCDTQPQSKHGENGYSRNSALRGRQTIQPSCYIKKRMMSNKRLNQFHTISHPPTPITKKKIVLSISINHLFYLKPLERKIIKFDIANQSFSSVDYIDACDFNQSNSREDYCPITLNISNGLFIVGGADYDRLYFYNNFSQTINELQRPKHSHRRGGAISYSNYLSEQRVILLCSDTHTKVDMYYADNKEWRELPEMTGHLSRVQSSYMLINKDFLFAFFGFDSVLNEYITSIKYLDLNKAVKWETIALKAETAEFNVRSHVMFNQKATAEGYTVCLLGGFNSSGSRSSCLTMTINKELTSADIITREGAKPQGKASYNFTSPLYEYVDTERRVFKCAFDSKFNAHIINKETLDHSIIDYSNSSTATNKLKEQLTDYFK